MRKGVFVLAVLAAMVIGTVAWGFEAYFSDVAGNKITQVQEGQKVYIAIKDPDKGACGIDEFQADLVIFDFKTGAYIWVEDDPNTTAYEGAWFRESATGSATYFWVTGPGSSEKVAVQIGSRANFTVVPYGMTHVLGSVSPAPVGVHANWEEGAWMYADEDVLGNNTGTANTNFAAFPQNRLAARVDFEGLGAGVQVLPSYIQGRLENMDTLVLIVADAVDKRNIDQDQLKIIDTQKKLSVSPTQITYPCGSACQNIVVHIEDKDEDLNPNEVEYVPFFVIVNPGGWNPANSQIRDFCTLMERGGYDPVAGDLNQPIRWYNIYDEPSAVNGISSRFIQYPADWLTDDATNPLFGSGVGRVLFFAQETGPDTGVFEYTFGNITDLQNALGFRRFAPGTTIAFYYVDPNDFDDMSVFTIQVGDRPHSQTYLTDSMGNPVDQVKLGGGLYVRVYDADANVNACCQDKVVVNICDIHGEDDSEYLPIDEVSNDSGIFASAAAMPLQPVWDAIGGYQLVIDDWKFQAFNEDTIYVRYNSVDYQLADLNALGDGNANDGRFPPAINDAAPRNQPWDVSFAQAKVYDTQVFDGTTHHMRFLNGRYEPVDEIPLSGNLYLEVTDPDQNENPLLAEMIAGKWNKDASATDDVGRTHAPRYAGGLLPDPTTLSNDAGEDSAPIWWLSARGQVPSPPPGPPAPPPPPGGGEQPPPPPPAGGDSDVMTPAGAVVDDTVNTPNWADPYLGGPQQAIRGNDDVSINAILETVKIFMWDAQNGNWEVLDLKETGVNTGVFRSTTCVLVADDRHPGDGNLGAAPGDTIMAFYQDPSNHSDVSIISIKVAEGGAAGVTPPTKVVEVAFDKDTYTAGDTVTITVTDDNYAGQPEISGQDILVLKIDGTTLQTWNEIPAVPGTTNQFQVTYTLPEDVSGTLTVTYTEPFPGGQSVSDTAEVTPAALQSVSDVAVEPNPFSTSVTFTLVTEPAGAKAEKMTVTIYDLLGHQVAEVSGTDTASVTWDGTDSKGTQLRNGAYIYVVVVEDSHLSAPFVKRGFVYIKR